MFYEHRGFLIWSMVFKIVYAGIPLFFFFIFHSFLFFYNNLPTKTFDYSFANHLNASETGEKIKKKRAGEFNPSKSMVFRLIHV